VKAITPPPAKGVGSVVEVKTGVAVDTGVVVIVGGMVALGIAASAVSASQVPAII
jgi:hypothetical protein